MKDYVESVKYLRENNVPHHNCAQAILVTFAEEMGMTLEQARAMGQHFGAGMGCGTTCGVVTGAAMTLGGLGYPKPIAKEMIQQFLKRECSLECRDLLAEFAKNAKNSPQNISHCDRLIFEMVEYIQTLEQEKHHE